MIKPNNCCMCGKEEFDGCWIRKDRNLNALNRIAQTFHYVCYRCINDFCGIIENNAEN
jgi:hypothetical protein